MLALPLALGGVLLTVVMVAGWSYRGWPGHRSCPACRAETIPVRVTGVARLLGRYFVRRWCGGCEWHGWGRPGPAFEPGTGPAAHDSGFRWNGEPGPVNPGFEWSRDDEPEVTGSADHPSGFQWGEMPPESHEGLAETRDRDPAPRAHPSGFRWSATPLAAPRFEWRRKEPPTRAARHFQWGARDD